MAVADDFVVSGTCAESLFGTCETFFRKDMDPDELFETLGQSLMAALDRDCISGWASTCTSSPRRGDDQVAQGQDGLDAARPFLCCVLIARQEGRGRRAMRAWGVRRVGAARESSRARAAFGDRPMRRRVAGCRCDGHDVWRAV
eukprot:TRINITY_DN730_c0_g1_i6.p1 TRINITY_DN730_c0_g1~~TRINITY_DN730_c0_g1_i6.p1  ORF type:complete len:152 (+),score=23.82 TRINITY_DN730_c0_g1_i6:26-457(+)